MSTPNEAIPTKLDPALIRVAGVIILGSFISVLDGTIMNVTLPALQKWFAAEDGTLANYAVVAWTISGYTLAQASVIPLTDWLSKRFGQRRVYILAVGLFTAASLACSFATSIHMLIILRIAQGIGGGCLMPLGTAILARAAGPARIGRIMAFMGVPMMLGPILGPILGGWLLHVASWHWIFLINVPFGVVGVIAGIIALPRDSAGSAPRLDIVGVLLMSPGLALTLWGVSAESSAGTFSIVSIAAVVTGVCLMAVFIWRSLTITHPLLDLRILRLPSFHRPVALMVTFQVGFFGILLILPAFLQQIQGLSPFQVGLLIAPSGIGSIITMPFASALIDRMPAGRVIPWGTALLALSAIPLTRLELTTPLWWLVAVQLLMGLGLGIVMMPTSSISLKGVTHEQVGVASTVYSIVGQVSSVSGVALVSVLLARGLQASPEVSRAIAGQTTGAQAAAALEQGAHIYGSVLWAPAVFLIIGFVVSLLLPMREKAEPVTRL